MRISIGQEFGRLRVDHALPDRHRDGSIKWFCVCACGGSTVTRAYCLFRGTTTSCGCVARKNSSLRLKTHGMKGTPTYRSWLSLRHRCLNQNDIGHWDRYGGRGITFCERWESFENFYEDMGERPDGMTIERKDNNGQYCKDNCTWASASDQSNNRITNRIIEVNGVRKTAIQWARISGIGSSTIRDRLKRGWTSYDSVTVPVTHSTILRAAGLKC